MTPEGKVKRWAGEQIERLLPGVVLYRPPGGAYGKAGEPDVHGCYGGCMFVIEAKVEGAEPTPLQWARLRAYQKAGALCMVLRGRELHKLQLLAKLIMERAECLKDLVKLQNT